MKATNKPNHFAAVIGALLAAGTLGVSSAQPPVDMPAFTVPFDAGVACSFPLTLEGSGARLSTKEYTDKNGNLNIFVSGTGYAFRYTNVANGKTTTTPSQGASQHIVVYPDGSQTWTNNGATLLIMFPTDIPAGPTTNYYNGHTALSITAEGVGTLTAQHGKNIDICAKLS